MELISASRRTDIPAFYAEWFVRRLEAGFCHILNPFNGSVRRVSLRPEDTIGIVCWTRHPAPLLPSLRRLQAAGHRFAFHYTINGFPRPIETHTPPADVAVRTFKALSDLVGPERVWWRYDPILITAGTPPAWHRAQFSRLASELAGYTTRCSFSFVSFYKKTLRNLAAAGAAAEDPELEARRRLAAELGAIARDRGIRLYSCCDDRLLQPLVEKAHCVGVEAFGDPDGGRFASPPPAPTRADCGCLRSVDIGAYDTCPFGCVYCYATNSRRAALNRRAGHDPGDTLLWRPQSLAATDLEKVEETFSAPR